jgi:hypothetical protein
MVAALIALLPLGTPAVQAQDQRPELRMQRSPAPLPIVPPDARKSVESDIQQALKELKAQERTDAIIRDNVRTVPSRPDLGQDVVGGIQSRALQDALRRR